MERSIGIAIGDNSIEAGWAGAAYRPVSAPARIVVAGAEFADFTDRVGDPVPLIGSDGTARLGADLVAVAVARLSAGSDRMSIAHPAAWGAYQAGVLRSALSCTDAQGRRLTLVSRPVAALAGAGRHDGVAIVVDIDRRGSEISLVVPGRVARTRTTELFGTEAVDRALAGHAMSALDRPLDREARRELLIGCARARAALAERPDAMIAVRLRTEMVRLRVVRDEFEALIGDAVAGLVADVARLCREADVEAPPILLVGALARTPLLVEMLGARVPGEVVVPADPEWTITRGALIASADPRPVRDEIETIAVPGRAGAPTGTVPAGFPQAGMASTGTVPAGVGPAGVAAAGVAAAGVAAAGVAAAGVAPTGTMSTGTAAPRTAVPMNNVAPTRRATSTRGASSARGAERAGAGEQWAGGVAAVRGGSRVRTAVVALAAGCAVLIGGAAVSGIGGHGGGSSISASWHGHR
jgi:hypothetical protein